MFFFMEFSNNVRLHDYSTITLDSGLYKFEFKNEIVQLSFKTWVCLCCVPNRTSIVGLLLLHLNTLVHGRPTRRFVQLIKAMKTNANSSFLTFLVLCNITPPEIERRKALRIEFSQVTSGPNLLRVHNLPDLISRPKWLADSGPGNRLDI